MGRCLWVGLLWWWWEAPPGIHGERSRLWYTKDLDRIAQHLPAVFVLSLPARFLAEPSSDVNFHNSQHHHDSLFSHWLANSYDFVVADAGRADLFFLPARNPTGQPYGGHHSDAWWNDIDKELNRMASDASYPTFALDRTMFASSFPIATLRKIHAGVRNIADVRYMRLDNDLTVNGRDVFVPYIIDPAKWRRNTQSNNASTMAGQVPGQEKLFFLSAVCREAYWDVHRIWRTKLYNQWRDLPNSMVVYSVAEAVYEHAWKNSHFCVILPGDTGSTAKLYMAIFAGCIPVIFLSFRRALPFVDYLDWSLFSVPVLKDIINHKTAMAQLASHLGAIRQDVHRLAAYKAALAEAAPLFDFGKRDFPSAYHLTLLEFAKDYQPKQRSNATAKTELAGYLL